MAWVSKTNITGLDKGRYAALLGDAHQHLVIGILMRLGFQVAHVTDRGLPYDIVVRALTRPGGEPVFLRCQVRTVRGGSIKFTGGVRGGQDRIYIRPSPKAYTYTTEYNDLVIGIEPETLDLYIIPTRFIEKWGKKSRSVRKLEPLKNNFEILLNWNDKYLSELEEKLPP